MKFPISFRQKEYNGSSPDPIWDQKYFPSLDGLRAVSVIMVILAHAKIGQNYGGMGVKIFFVISGFLITTLLIKEKIRKGDISLKAFYIRRFLRIIPLAYLFLFTVWILKWVMDLYLPNYYLLLGSVFLINFYMGAHYIGHFWSLSVEEQFYAIFPYFLKKDLKTYTRFLLILLGAIIFLDLLPFLPSQFPKGSWQRITLLLFNPVKEFDAIILGALTSLFLFHFRLDWNPKFLPYLKTVIFLILVPILILLYTLNIPFPDGTFFQPPIVNIIEALILSILLVLLIIPQKDLVYRFLNLKIIRFIGVLSYSLYVWQQIFVIDIPWKPFGLLGKNKFLQIGLLFVIALISHYGYERKFLKLKARFEV